MRIRRPFIIKAALVLILSGGAYTFFVTPAFSAFPSTMWVTAPLTNGEDRTTRFACWVTNVWGPAAHGTMQLVGSSGIINSLDFSLDQGEIGGLVSSTGGVAYCRIVATKPALLQGGLSIEQEGIGGFVTIAATPAFEQFVRRP